MLSVSSDYSTLTGLSKEHFDDLHSFISSEFRNTQNLGTRILSVVFHLKLRLGCSTKLTLPSLDFQSQVSAEQSNLILLCLNTQIDKMSQRIIHDLWHLNFLAVLQIKSYCCF